MSSKRTTVQRAPERGHYDSDTIRSILADGKVCHIGFIDSPDEGPYPVVIPTAYGLFGDEIVMHGLPASRLLKVLRVGSPISVAVTHFDGLVLARSAFEHSMNYRSVVIFGEARWIRDTEEKLLALEAISEHLLPGRWADVKQPTVEEIKQTHILALGIAEASAKVRTGPPAGDEDIEWDAWTGVLPAATGWGTPIPRDGENRALPSYVPQNNGQPPERE